MGYRKNESGHTYGRLTVVAEEGRTPRNLITWKCVCLCGKEVVVVGRDLRVGDVKSCGCWSREYRTVGSTVHGKSQSQGYKHWQHMKRRCLDLSSAQYPRYGGAGIGVCDRWLSFENFHEDMGDPPKGYTLDRVDNAQGYYPENCRWSDATDQNRNRGNALLVEHNGERQRMWYWVETLGLSYNTLYARFKAGKPLV